MESSRLRRDGSPEIRDLRWGVYVVFEGETDYARRCFTEYGVATDPSGRYAALCDPIHFIGLELGISVASVGTGAARPRALHRHSAADVVATAKRDLAARRDAGRRGRLHGVWQGDAGGRIVASWRPAARPRPQAAAAPYAAAAGHPVRWEDVEIDEHQSAVAFRREMEKAFASPA